LPGGPVGLPAWWAATSNVAGKCGTKEEAQGPLAREEGVYLDILFAGVPEFLVTPLLMGPVCLLSQGRFEDLVSYIALKIYFLL